jgi:hypothetical protein
MSILKYNYLLKPDLLNKRFRGNHTLQPHDNFYYQSVKTTNINCIV